MSYLIFIRLLSNIKTDKQKILHTIFSYNLNSSKTKDAKFEASWQRVAVTYGIEPFSYNKVKPYIKLPSLQGRLEGTIGILGEGFQADTHHLKRISSPHQHIYLRSVSVRPLRTVYTHGG